MQARSHAGRPVIGERASLFTKPEAQLTVLLKEEERPTPYRLKASRLVPFSEPILGTKGSDNADSTLVDVQTGLFCFKSQRAVTSFPVAGLYLTPILLKFKLALSIGSGEASISAPVS